jgi:hypothetical protein
MAGHVAHIEVMIAAYKISFQKHESKERSVARPWHEWKDTIKIYVKSLSGLSRCRLDSAASG